MGRQGGLRKVGGRKIFASKYNNPLFEERNMKQWETFRKEKRE